MENKKINDIEVNNFVYIVTEPIKGKRTYWFNFIYTKIKKYFKKNNTKQ